ncbi:MAG: hypothetical protein ACI35W_01275 [Anaeroplasmataceae bacterium]
MEVKFKKRNHNNLRKLIKVDSNNNVLEPQTDLYVRIEEAEGNVLNDDATLITEDVIENINWKDNESVVFKESAAFPDPIEGIAQLVSNENGELWLVNDKSNSPFRIGGPLDNTYLLKNTNCNELISIKGTGLSLDAKNNLNEVTSSLQVTPNGFSVRTGNREVLINDSEVSLKDHNTYTITDSNGDTYVNQGSTFGILNGTLYIKGMQSQISEDVVNSKLNFLTNYKKAIFGTNEMYVEIANGFIRLKTPTMNILQVKNDGGIYNSNNKKLVDEASINGYIEDYLNDNFCYQYIKSIEQLKGNTLITFGATTEQIIDITDGRKYKIGYSDAANSRLYEIEVVMSNFYFDFTNNENNSEYTITQYYASGDGEDDFIRIQKNNTTVYVRYISVVGE